MVCSFSPQFHLLYYFRVGRDNSVGIATGYGLDRQGIEFRCGWEFPCLSRPALRLTHPPVQLVPGLSPGVKSGRGVTLTPHPLLVLWSLKGAVQPVQSLSASTRVTFTFTFTFILFSCLSNLHHGICVCGVTFKYEWNFILVLIEELFLISCSEFFFFVF